MRQRPLRGKAAIRPGRVGRPAEIIAELFSMRRARSDARYQECHSVAPTTAGKKRPLGRAGHAGLNAVGSNPAPFTLVAGVFATAVGVFGASASAVSGRIDHVIPAVDEPGGPAGPRWILFLRGQADGLPRAFRVLWSGVLINRLGTVVVPFLALYLSGPRGLSVQATGAVLAVCGAGSVLSQLAGGILADRIDRRGTLAGAMLANASCMIALGYPAAIPAIVAVVFLLGLSFDMYRPAQAAILADLISPAERPRAFALIYWAVNLGFDVAMVLGGALAASASCGCSGPMRSPAWYMACWYGGRCQKPGRAAVPPARCRRASLLCSGTVSWSPSCSPRWCTCSSSSRAFRPSPWR
jgi:hypothetical protein